MCGIAGCVGSNQDDCRSMIQTIEYRGPDGEGLYSHGNVSLGHRRLSIIDLSPRGAQPMKFHHQGRRLVLVFNGEIYNFRELRRELEAQGCGFSTDSDSEVILAAYASWGSNCVRRFNGMWAFAIYDETNRSLFCSRDRFGKKPFYYFQGAGHFAFASEIKALLRLPFVERRVDERAVHDLLYFDMVGHTDGTFFESIRQLPAGHSGFFDCDRMTFGLQRYYALPRDTTPLENGQIGALLEKAIERRLVSDVPVCLSLSGGIDSSSVAVCVSAIHDDRMVAFTTTTTSGPGDESAQVKELLARYHQFELVEVPVPRGSPVDLMQRIVWHMDEPCTHDSPFVRWAIAEGIHRGGFKVALTGEGADELLGGYHMAASRFLRDLSADHSFGRLTSALFWTFFQPDRRIILNGWLRLMRGVPDGDDSYLGLARERGIRIPFEPDRRRTMLRDDASLKDMLHHEVTTYFLPYLLCCNDKMYMAHSVESRAPFLDVELAELLLAVPYEQLIARGFRKYPLRAAMRDAIPSRILFDRKKLGFASPLQTDLTRPEARASLRPLLKDLRSSRFVDPEMLTRRYDEACAAGEVDRPVLAMIWLELWMRAFDL